MPVPGRKAYERRHFNDSNLYQQHQPEVDDHRIRAFGVPSRGRRISSEPDRLERAVPFYGFEDTIAFFGFEDTIARWLSGFEDTVALGSCTDRSSYPGTDAHANADPGSFTDTAPGCYAYSCADSGSYPTPCSFGPRSGRLRSIQCSDSPCERQDCRCGQGRKRSLQGHTVRSQ